MNILLVGKILAPLNQQLWPRALELGPIEPKHAMRGRAANSESHMKIRARKCAAAITRGNNRILYQPVGIGFEKRERWRRYLAPAHSRSVTP